MLSVLIPANNEAEGIGACLQAVLDSVLPEGEERPEIVVIANGCSDDTALVARGYAKTAEVSGWQMQVLDLAIGDKLKALNAGDQAASHGSRVYLDADVSVDPLLIGQLQNVLAQRSAVYASGSIAIPQPQSRASRAYRRIYLRVPFITDGVPGCGVYAVNAAGRGRWSEFPDIISDDTFVRLQFSPEERVSVPAGFHWPIVEGFNNLVRVRRRQDAGVTELRQEFPDMFRNDDKVSLGFVGATRLAMSDPVGFAVYAAVALTVRLSRKPAGNRWTRGR
ncbi:MAG: glycosyltransferase [Rhodobacteraceae bacterium]|nr:glycosyltransferase [Paracoccaceae bacterium]